MIPMTDEMRGRAYHAARTFAIEHRHSLPDDRMLDDVITAVLAIVERDYDVTPRIGPQRGHAFQPHDDPAFGSAFGGGCGAEVATSTGPARCGWPRGAHRSAS